MSKRVPEELIAASCVKKARLDGHGQEVAASQSHGLGMIRDMDDDTASNSSRDTLESCFSSSGLSQLSEVSIMSASLLQAVVPESSSQKGEGKARRRRQTIAQAVARPRRNRRRGCLEVLLNMPVEIFCEIASHLTPQDLLHMARSCRLLRDHFMSKRSMPIWRSAREALGLPECPPDLSEPQYTDLVFFKGCYSCGAGRAQTLHFTFRLRLCRQCSDTHVVQLSQLRKLSPLDKEFREFLRMVPHITFTLTGNFYHEILVHQMWQQYVDWSLDPSVYPTFFEEKVKEAEAIMEHAERVNTWIRERDERLRIEREGKGIIREKLIIERLHRECGYSSTELDTETGDTWKNYQLWVKLTRDPKPLTDRIWRNLKPKLENVIDMRRQYRRGSGRSFAHIMQT